jgi:hypothetical protein
MSARKPMLPATVELMLRVKPLIDQLAKGDKRAALQRAWINCVRDEAAAMLDQDVGRLPTNMREAARALMRACIQLASRAGLDGVELCDFFTETADSGAVAPPVDADEAIRRCYALLGVIQAHDMAADAGREVA